MFLNLPLWLPPWGALETNWDLFSYFLLLEYRRSFLLFTSVSTFMLDVFPYFVLFLYDRFLEAAFSR